MGGHNSQVTVNVQESLVAQMDPPRTVAEALNNAITGVWAADGYVGRVTDTSFVYLADQDALPNCQAAVDRETKPRSDVDAIVDESQKAVSDPQ